MPSRLDISILQVNANVIHKVDTTNTQNLFSMWTVFARCADSVAQGRRLENLSWRLWTCETFCVDKSDTPSTASLPRNIQHSKSNSTEDIPRLSGSVDSVADEEAIEFSAQSAPREILRPGILRQGSCASSQSRGKERHITSDDFEKMVASIVQQKEPLDAPLPEIASTYNPPHPEAKELVPTYEHSRSTSPESHSKAPDAPSFKSPQQPSSPDLAAASRSKTTFVRGFSPSQAPACRSIQTPHKASSDDSIPESTSRNPLLTAQKEQASFSNQLVTCIRPAPAVIDESETEGDDVNESAIDDDDDSSDWEDSIEDSGKSSINDKTFFQCVNSSVKPMPKLSLITLMLAQNDRQPPSLVASPNDSDEAPLMMRCGTRGAPLRPINEVPRSSPQPIMTQAAWSPRTTCRNMLATELTESLRRHLLWERSQKSSTANAVLKRHHASHDVANLKQHAEVYISNGYHSNGW